MEPEDDKSETSTTISTLPDSILCHILSFLPTRTSMATSVLSRRWRHLWKHLHLLNLDGYSFNTPQLSRDQVEERFVDFVNEVLHQVHVRRIQKFRLEGEVRNYSRTLSFWIDAVTSGPHLQELYLSLWNSSGSFNTLPYSVLSCTSLVSLVLKGDIIVSFDNLQSLQLPSLKSLDLEIIAVELDKLLSLCPALETLKVFIFFNSGGIDPNEIHVPRSLKRLTLESEACDWTVDHLEIHTPSLEYLDIALVACYSQISVRTYPNLVEACLNICFDDMHIDWMPKLLNAVCGTKLLALQASTTACLICVPSLEFPQFFCLVRLQIGFEFFNSRVLIDLLHCCCKLEALLIHACKSVSYGCLYGEPVEPSSWTQPVSVPSCVVSHLNIIEFRDYEDLEEEHEFIAYVIERGLVLKTVTIHTRTFTDQEIKDHILKKLSVVPIGSSICQLKLE